MSNLSRVRGRACLAFSTFAFAAAFAPSLLVFGGIAAGQQLRELALPALRDGEGRSGLLKTYWPTGRR